MGKTKNNALSEKDYLKELNVNSTEGEERMNYLKELIQIAMETRKFEIELYWKRANYFWLFVSICFTAYYVTSKPNVHKECENLIAAVLGYVLSFCWYFANRGSKYWQENWEQHIAVLTYEYGAPIFELLKSNKNKWINLMKSYPYSVSRINQILNIVVIVAWGFLLYFSLHRFIDENSNFRCVYIYIENWWLWLIALGAAIVIPFGIHYCSRSFVIRENKDHENTFFTHFEKRKNENDEEESNNQAVE